MEELEALLILNSIPHVGSIKIRSLIKHYGSAVDVLRAPIKEIETFPGFGPKILQLWEQGIKESHWKNNLNDAQHLNIDLIPYTSPYYPKRLLEVADFPLVLYVKGSLLKVDQRSLAIIGTRQATLYGLEMARQLSFELARAGFTIVSGLARGIDAAAHQGSIDGGRSIAVLGSGLGCIYPHENKALADSISKNGAVISEFSISTPPDRQHFPQRNRIVSGLTLGTILIEAPIKSGAMLTVERSLALKRPVFVLPGRADQENFRGNHSLLKERRADLIEGSYDILKFYNECCLPLGFSTSQNTIPLDEEEKVLLQKMPTQEVSIEELIASLSWPVAQINSLLMSLVLKKIVKEYPGKIYKKI